MSVGRDEKGCKIDVDSVNRPTGRKVQDVIVDQEKVSGMEVSQEKGSGIDVDHWRSTLTKQKSCIFKF